MSDYLTIATEQPATYIIAAILIVCLLLEAISLSAQLRWVFAGLIYFSIVLFYLIDPIIRSEGYSAIAPEEFFDAYLQVILFLVSFRALLPLWAPATPSSVLRAFNPAVLSDRRFVGTIIGIWLILFTIGVSRLDFDILGALFPVEGRTTWRQLWARPRLGGSFDFLISAIGYAYEFVCSLFGLVAVSTRNSRVRTVMVVMIFISWPHFILCGARHKIIAVFMPSILAVILSHNWNRAQQIAFVATAAMAINTLMLLVVQFRNDGLNMFFESGASLETVKETKHLGLNMTEELVMINRYQSDGTMPPEWGYEYFANLVAFVPRPLWQGKPAVGTRFAELRVGYHRGALASTVSYGIVGQGVVDFGKWLGPFAPSIFLALLARWVSRLMEHGNPFLRASLVLTCFGMLPALGRDLTFIIFCPLIFGIIGVKIYEHHTRSSQRQGNMASERRLATR